MIVLHAGFLDGELVLWAESSPESESIRSGKRRRKGAPPHGSVDCKPLPYDAGKERLFAALQESGFSSRFDKKSIGPMTVWLPTLNNKPLPSSSLIDQPPEPVASASLKAWKITALQVPLERATEHLCRAMDKQTLGLGIAVGKDLAFWATALRFVGSLVENQQFLPSLRHWKGKYIATWKPIFSGLNAERLSRLARAMPAAARAVTEEPSSPPDTSPLPILTAFIGVMVDHLVRSSIIEGIEAAPLPKRRRTKERAPYDSVHDQWLDALCSRDGLMEGDTGELSKLARQVTEWERPLSVSAAAPYRLCLRIEEPSGDGEIGETARSGPDRWYVRYLLQANHDPSLQIPAKEVWRARNIPSSTEDDFNVREYLLLSLGQASRICPHIEASLRTSTPAGYTLDATGAYQFFTQKALMLEQSGFGVMLPAWWTRKGTKLHLKARANVKAPKMQSSGGLSLEQIVQFDWEVALGEERLSLEELQRLAKLKAPLVKLRGQWVQINPEEIKAAIEFWKKKSQEQATVREIMRMALGGGKTPGNVSLEGVTATGWIADLLAALDGRSPFRELSPPQGFQGTLRPYQVRGYSWLSFLRKWGLGACLADDMGLGKTIQTLALVQRDWESEDRRPVLLICPTSVVSNWQKEAARFTPALPVMVHHGIGRNKGEEFKKMAVRQAMVISSYALLHRDLETFKEMDWAGLVLDEAQNIKNPETKQAKAARTLKADYRIVLTGTPVENHVGDLWSIMEFLNAGLLGTPSEFKNGFFIPIQAGRDPEAAERLKRLTGPFILRRVKTDKAIIADLPEKMEMKVFCTLTKEQASLYEAVVKETMEKVDETEGIQRKGLVLATLSKLKQVCNHPAQFLSDNSPIPGRSGKLARMTEMVEEMVEVGDRALIFSQFAQMGSILQRHLQEMFGREVLFLHGGVPKKQRDEMVERFQSGDNGPSLFVLSLKAGGTGLNLTRANHVIHFDRWWNPAVENQATDRAFRIGQTKNVQVHKFICAGTLEDKIDEMIERKKGIADKVLGIGESWLTELSTAELKNLFALRKEAIGE